MMKGATMKATLEKLGIMASYSRPRVSNDNPFSEALFRTFKYRPNWPTKGFASKDEAQAWVKSFTSWYNTPFHGLQANHCRAMEHLHSALRFVTPNTRHAGLEYDLLNKRAQLYANARAANPARWSRQTRNWQPVGAVWLNPERADDVPKIREAA